MRRALRVLFIDDDEDDRLLLKLALNHLEDEHTICTVESAEGAIRLLEAKDWRSLPDLILIDLRMPGIDGFGFLDWLKRHPSLRSVPAIVLSGSAARHDVDRAYDLGARGFMTKLVNFDETVRAVKAMLAYWSHCELPAKLLQLSSEAPLSKQ